MAGIAKIPFWSHTWLKMG